MELSRVQIIRILGVCSENKSGYCEDCPYLNLKTPAKCLDELMADAIAIMLQDEQTIFELENRLKECENGYAGTLALERAKVKELTEENERLKLLLDDRCDRCIERNRAGTVWEMTERLKARFDNGNDRIYTGYNIHRFIDQIAKEMLEGNNEQRAD